MQGWRDAMEDAIVCAPSLGGPLKDCAVFAVFDGHGGQDVSAFVGEQVIERVSAQLLAESGSEPLPEGAAPAGAGNALKRALMDLELELRRLNTPAAESKHDAISKIPAMASRCRFDLMGCTATMALVTRTSITTVNVGDSRIFKCRNGECVPLTRDHKPESPRERRRIEAVGGTVVKLGPCYRVDYNLNLSRSLGDFRYKDPRLNPEDQKICAVGDIQTAEIDENDEFIVVACDGLFELMTWNSVCEYVRERIKSMPLELIAQGLLDQCCSPDMFATGGRGTDNESVIIVKLHDPA